MAYPEIVEIEHGVITDLEIENMQFRDDYEDLKRRYEAERKYSQKQRDNAIWWRKECERKGAARNQTALETLVRNILDETELEDDDENMRELRKMLWNNTDTEKQLKAEYGDRDEEINTEAWHEMNAGE